MTIITDNNIDLAAMIDHIAETRSDGERGVALLR
ncbi:MAG: hypothetical protein JWM58_2335 [Rhizobium sp.]|nr:hypothetical protein [Rhizobium sp.]